MDARMLNTIANFIWGIADDCLRDVYVRGKYRDVILPMTVIRRLDAVLEDENLCLRTAAGGDAGPVLEKALENELEFLQQLGARYAIQLGRLSATLRPSACAT